MPGRRIPSPVHLTAKFILLPWSWVSRALPLTPKGTGMGQGGLAGLKGHLGSLRPSAVGGQGGAGGPAQGAAEGEGLGQPCPPFPHPRPSLPLLPAPEWRQGLCLLPS